MSKPNGAARRFNVTVLQYRVRVDILFVATGDDIKGVPHVKDLKAYLATNAAGTKLRGHFDDVSRIIVMDTEFNELHDDTPLVNKYIYNLRLRIGKRPLVAPRVRREGHAAARTPVMTARAKARAKQEEVDDDKPLVNKEGDIHDELPEEVDIDGKLPEEVDIDGKLPEEGDIDDELPEEGDIDDKLPDEDGAPSPKRANKQARRYTAVGDTIPRDLVDYPVIEQVRDQEIATIHQLQDARDTVEKLLSKKKYHKQNPTTQVALDDAIKLLRQRVRDFGKKNKKTMLEYHELRHKEEENIFDQCYSGILANMGSMAESFRLMTQSNKHLTAETYGDEVSDTAASSSAQ